MLSAEGIHFQYGSGKEVLTDVGFDLKAGQFLAILGNNGVGKSTLLKCINRILRVKGGRIRLQGEDILSMTGRDVARRMAFVAQNVPNNQMTVYDTVMLGRKPYMGWGFTENDHRIIHGVMERMGIWGLGGCYLSSLSGGERQKVALARALAQEAKVLLLDEPTSSLDIQNQHQVLQLVRDICDQDKIGAVMVIHDLNLALRYCDSFLMMRDGRVYDRGDRSIIHEKSLLDVYGIEARIVDVEGQRLVLV